MLAGGVAERLPVRGNHAGVGAAGGGSPAERKRARGGLLRKMIGATDHNRPVAACCAVEKRTFAEFTVRPGAVLHVPRENAPQADCQRTYDQGEEQ
jgi:hypothetical protein